MITCKRCGNLSPAGVVSCQTCGAPLSSKVEMGPGPSGMAAPQEPPGLPAWLESLRAGERSATPASDNPSSFSTADLIEEGSLPSWMRSGRPEVKDASSPHLVLRSSSAPGPNTDDSQGINAKSLIDESALPSWMQENKQATGPIPLGGIAASSLVQSDFVPEWMKALQPQQQSSSNPVMPPVQAASPPAFSTPYGQPEQHEAPVRSDDFARQHGFSAGDLIDQQSLPSWMSQQGEKNAATPEPAASGGLSPSSLLDMNALPSWLRENGQQEQRSGSFPSAQQPWQSAPPTMQTPPIQNQPGSIPEYPMQMPSAPGMVNNLSASSFIDPNALPEWLRSGAGGMGGAIPQSQSPVLNSGAVYGAPPRIENMRVPSRPRGEINPNENNEAAANVFASMLGVASASPGFPASGQPYGVPNPPGANMPGFAGTQEPQQLQGYAPGGYNSGVYQNPNAGPQGNYQTGNLGPQGNYQTGNLQPGANQYPMSPMANAAGMSGKEMGTDQRSATKPVKKGFFDTIRDWFR